MLVDVDYSDVQEVSADGRGRVTLGSEYANETVVVAVLDRDDVDASTSE